MSWNPAFPPGTMPGTGTGTGAGADTPLDAIETVIVPRSRDIGGRGAAPCLRPSGKWWGRSCSSIRRARRSS